MGYYTVKIKEAESKMKIKLKILIASVIFSMAMAINVFGATQNVNVILPAFDVRLNGIEIDNENRDYPLIVYKGITYFPMTYHDSRFLGLETTWNKVSGLKVNKNNIQVGYVDNISASNKSKYTAAIIDVDVEVNGKIIDNAKEQYPLLLFRDVTYFPLTWRFAVDEFGWDYKFTEKNGLDISSKSNSLEVSKVNMSVADRGDSYNNKFIASGDYFYYEGYKGIIYQTLVADPSERKSVYELPMWTYGDSYVYPSLETVDGKAMLSYHQGGATMGTDYRIILNEDGTNETFSVGYRNRVDFGDVIVDVSHFPPPYPNNLSIKKEGEEEYKSIGNANYVYGWVKNVGSSGSADLYKIDDEIYILANIFNEEKATTGIHRVNINTGKTVRICEESVKRFIIEDDIIYFMDLEGYLYKIAVDGNNAEKLTDFTVSDFTVLNNIVYYVTAEDKGLELFKLGESASVNPAGRVKKLVNSDDGYVYCIFENNSPYKLIVFSKDGVEVFKTNSNIRFAWIDNNRLFYQM